MFKDPYKVLHVSRNASLDEIKKAYHKLARQYHPDINKSPEAEDKFKDISNAYEILSDPKKKAEYDRHGERTFGNPNFHDFSNGYRNANFGDINDVLKEVFGMRGGYNRSGTKFDFGDGISDIDLDIRANINISLRNALKGEVVNINLNNSSFKLKIPKGATNGTELRAKGRGNRLGNQIGNAIITVNIAPEEGFKIEGMNVVQEVEVPLKTMLFGGKIDVNAIQKDIKIKIPENTQNGSRMRVEKMGFTNLKTGTVGDLMLRLNVKLPNAKGLSTELREILEKEL